MRQENILAAGRASEALNSLIQTLQQEFSKALSCESIQVVWMQCGSGSSDSKNHEHTKYECLIPFMQCASGTACGSAVDFFSAPWSDSCCCRKTSAVESGYGLYSHHFCCCCWLRWTLINSYRSFQEAGNRNEGQLQKTQLRLYEVVIGAVFRPLFCGTVQPKALLSFGSSSPFFIPSGEV